MKTVDGTDEVVCCEKKTGKFDFYNIITDGHLNLFANGILTSCRLGNYRKFDPVAMKFSSEARRFRSEGEFGGVPQGWIEGLHLYEQPMETESLGEYVANLRRNMLPLNVASNIMEANHDIG